MANFGESVLKQSLRSMSSQVEATMRKAEQARAKEEKRLLKIEDKKASLLGDPLKLDRYAAGVSQLLSPSTKKPKYSKHNTRTEAVTASIPEDHPMSSFGEDFGARLTSALQDPRYGGIGSEEIGKALAEKMYAEEVDPLTGRTRYEAALTYKARKDHSLMRAMGLRGEDTSIKKPAGYDEYIQTVKDTPAENTFSSPLEIAGVSAGMAAVWRGGIHAIAKTKLPFLAARAGAAVTKAPHPVAKAVGLGLTIAGGWLTYEAFENALNRTIYGKTHEGGKWLKPSTWDKEILELGGTILTGGVFKKGATAVIAKAAEKDLIHNTLMAQFQKFPTAANAIELGKGRISKLGADANVDKLKVPGTARYDIIKQNERKTDVYWGNFFGRTEPIIKPGKGDALDRMREASIRSSSGATQRSTLLYPEPITPGVAHRPANVDELYSRINYSQPRPVDHTTPTKVLTAVQAKNVTQAYLDRTGQVRFWSKKGVVLRKKKDATERLLNEEVPPAAKLSGNRRKIFSNLDDEGTKVVIDRSPMLGIDTATMEYHFGKTLGQLIAKQEKKLVIPKEVSRVPGVEAFSGVAKGGYVVAGRPEKTGKLFNQVKRAVVTKEPTSGPAIGVTSEQWNVLQDKMYSTRLADKTIDFVNDVIEAGGVKLDALMEKAVDTGNVNTFIASIVSQLGKNEKVVANALLKKEAPIVAKPLKTGLRKLNKEQLELRNTLEKKLVGRELSKAKEAELKKQLKSEKDMEDFLLGEEAETYLERHLDYDAATDTLNGLSKWTMGIIAGATLIPIAGLLAPSDAEAGIQSMIPEKLGKYATKVAKGGAKKVNQYINEMIDETLVALPVNGAKVVPTPMLSKEGAFDTAAYATVRFGDIRKVISKTQGLALFADRFMSTSGFGRLYFLAGGSPAPELGVRHIATAKNIDNAFEVVGNILSEVPGVDKRSAIAIEARMTDLAKTYQDDVVALGSAEFEMASLNKVINSITKDLKKKRIKKSKLKEHKLDLERAQQKLAKLGPVRNKLESRFNEFNARWTNQVKDLAKQHPSTRIALAAEDTTNFDYYPWLRDLMKAEEREAVGYVKTLMGSYKQRAKGAGLSVIENRPYMHHAFHPTWNEKRLQKYLKSLDIDVGIGTPMTKFWHRSKYSKMMMPDITYTLQRYIPDAESRIQWSSFWGKGKKNSWWALSKSEAIQGSAPLRAFFDRLKYMAAPESMTTWNRMANRYSAVEVFRLLAASPSVAFKHAFKLTGTWSNLGFGSAAKHLPETFKVSTQNMLGSKALGDRIKLHGIEGIKNTNDAKRLAVKTYSNQGRLLSNMMDMDLVGRPSSGFDTFVQSMNKYGGSFVRGVESFDRAHSFLAALDMASKKGLTTKDAMYGIMETILHNNFLSGALNPQWMKDPKVRAMLLFQNTPFKLLERRLLGAGATLRVGKRLVDFRKTDKTAFNKELVDLKNYIFQGQDNFKRSQIMEALGSEKDFMGSNVPAAFMKEMVMLGLLFTGGSSLLGWNLTPQLFHLPFLRHDTVQPTVAVSPIIQGALRTKADVIRSHADGEETEFFVTSFMNNWLGKGHGIPLTMHKLLRLSNNDIPDRYKDSAFQYLFAIPASGEH